MDHEIMKGNPASSQRINHFLRRTTFSVRWVKLGARHYTKEKTTKGDLESLACILRVFGLMTCHFSVSVCPH